MDLQFGPAPPENLTGRVLLHLGEGTCVVLIGKRKVKHGEVFYAVKIGKTSGFLPYTRLLQLVQATSAAIQAKVTALGLHTIVRCDFEGSFSHYVPTTNPSTPLNGGVESCRCDLVSLDVDGNPILIHDQSHQIYLPGPVNLVENIRVFHEFFVLPLASGYNNRNVNVEKGETGIVVKATNVKREERSSTIPDEDIAEFLRLHGPEDGSGPTKATTAVKAASKATSKVVPEADPVAAPKVRNEAFYEAAAAVLPTFCGDFEGFEPDALPDFRLRDPTLMCFPFEQTTKAPLAFPPLPEGAFPCQDKPFFAIAATINWLEGPGAKFKDVLFPDMPTRELAELIQKKCGCLNGITPGTMESTMFQLHSELRMHALDLDKACAQAELCLGVVGNGILQAMYKKEETDLDLMEKHVATLEYALKWARGTTESARKRKRDEEGDAHTGDAHA
jgi:hypothetical protein